MQRNLFIQLTLAALGLCELLALAACVPSTLALSTPTSSTSTTAQPSAIFPSPLPTMLPTDSGKTPTRAIQTREPSVPAFTHIYMIVMENQEYGEIVDRAEAAYLNSLIAQYGLAANYTAPAHPSEPNYFALFSGSVQGATGDGVYDFDAANLADQIEATGKTWRVFAEKVPTNCFMGEVASNGSDGNGLYVRKHNPAISFTDISRSPARCANITDLTHFDPAAANYALIIPNMCNDMHDCSVATGDNFLKGFVPRILSSRAWQDDGALFITWDEGTTSQGSRGRVPLIVISTRVTKGFRSAVAYNHYSLLRTIEDAWGMECLNHACAASNLSEFFR